MHPIKRRALLGAGAALAWPARPLRIVVPFSPGGTSDFVTRPVGVEPARSLGQPVIVENKPGAGTVIGIDAVAKSAPDASSFVTVASSFTANQTPAKELPYDTLRDLRPVALMGMSEHVLATHPASDLKTLADLARRVRDKPGTLSYASVGNGTSAHLSGELLKHQMGIDLVHVPYLGQSLALADLLGGQVTVMFGNWPEFRSHVERGKLVALGMATARRSVYAPDIPTLAEQSLRIESNSWNGLLAPAATPDAIMLRMNAEVNRALASATVAEAFRKGALRRCPARWSAPPTSSAARPRSTRTLHARPTSNSTDQTETHHGQARTRRQDHPRPLAVPQ